MLLSVGTERHGEDATGNASNERSPIHHSITGSINETLTILRFQVGLHPAGDLPLVADEH